MEEIVVFLYILAIVWAILSIVLFFKVWGMTNDIRLLKMDHFDSNMPEDIPQLRAYLRVNLLLGEKEKVRQILIRQFMDNINKYCNPNRSSYLNTNDPALDVDITPYVNLLKKQFSKINMDVPEPILKMKTFRDFYEILKEEDFIIGN